MLSEKLVTQLCLILCDPMDCRFLCPWNSPGKNTGVGSHSFLQGIFPTQGSKPGLLHCRQILYHLSHQRSPSKLKLPLSLTTLNYLTKCTCLLSLPQYMLVIAFESDPVLTQQVYFWAKKMCLHLVLCNFPENFEKITLTFCSITKRLKLSNSMKFTCLYVYTHLKFSYWIGA